MKKYFKPKDRIADPPGSDGERLLQKEYKTVLRAQAFYKNQVCPALNSTMRQFITSRDMVFISTADSKGHCDSSIRAGPQGFVKVLDETTLAYPEYRGNGVLASLGNIQENPHIGLLFVDFYKSTVGLHVNGRARIFETENILKDPLFQKAVQNSSSSDVTPERWVIIEIDEAYIHCSKHIPLMQKLDKKIRWGTDDKSDKKSNYFKYPKK